MRNRVTVYSVLGLICVAGVGMCFTFDMPGTSHDGPLPVLTPEQKKLSGDLRGHVEKLAVEIGERNVLREYEALRKAASYLEDQFKKLGYGVRSQSFKVKGQTVRNIEATKFGQSSPKEYVVLGAHYDTAEGTAGANDNGTGVAALLELARLLKDIQLDRSVRFVGFVNEEPPWFKTKLMGSVQYAKECRKKKDNIVAMLSLETIGYYSDTPGSQRYPKAIGSFFPDTGNFISFVGDESSRPLVKKTVALFRKHAKFPSEGAALPATLTGIGWSDHWSFWQEGYQALMVTDTAFFRDPNYHQPSDTPASIDFKKTARVVSGLAKVVEDLASR